MSYFKNAFNQKSLIDDSSVYLEPCSSSNFIELKRMHYNEENTKKTWDIIKSLDSVAVLLYEKESDCFVIVKQFRPAIYARHFHFKHEIDGYTYELCAGLVDKANKSLEEIACEEALEECGYQISPKNLETIGQFYSATGLSGSLQTLYYAEVCADLKVSKGGGIDAEKIEVLFLERSKALDFIMDFQYAKTTGLSLAILWHLKKFKNV
ncbi:NUDIX domain-containing protein [Helicobacter pylori]|uniref:NUDIX hydrolase n=1 Tax=Helicobacter pylori TaxID=210 RepID=UPI000BEABCCD|nr:NUDIX hydrolase [Helicobacter pylori]MCQ2862329.1 NUDIX hydrolase [Helicobacter pylori]PDW27990.1 NUDIX hydrolase [Helicobacter pylori]UOS52824.1 NUDIX hydrolase [Helicobacter pylori]